MTNYRRETPDPSRTLPFAVLALVLGLTLAACQPQDSSTAGSEEVEAVGSDSAEAAGADQGDAGELIATVDGRPITAAAFEHYLSQKQSSSAQPVDPNAVLNEMINIELLTASAEEAGYDQRESVRLELERQRKGLLANLALEERISAVQISQDQIETAYQEQYVDADNTEYKASHILVESKQEAEALIGQLESGADFAELARQHSVGPSAPRGGDLGWFNVGSVVPEFGKAVAALPNGMYTDEPVQSQFGWHVIERVDSRTPEPPALDEVEQELRRTLTTRSVANYLRDLRESAQIEIEGQSQ